MKKIQQLLTGLFAVPVIYLFLLSIFGSCVMSYTDEHTFYIGDPALLLCAGLLLLILIPAFILAAHRRRSGADGTGAADATGSVQKLTAQDSSAQTLSARRRKWLRAVPVVLTLLWAAGMLYWIRITLMDPVNDQIVVFNGAKDLLAGQYDAWKKGGYFYTLNNQNNTVLMFSLLMRIGLKSVRSFEILNLLCWFLTVVSLSLMTAELAGKKAGWLMYACGLCFLPMMGYVTFIYGTVPGICCIVWAVFLEQRFLQQNHIRDLVLCLLLAYLAVLWKQNNAIFLIAMLLILLLHGFAEKKRTVLLGSVLMLLVMLLSMKTGSFVLHEMTGEQTDGGTPASAYLEMGLQDSPLAPGWYNGYVVTEFEKLGYDQAATNQAAGEKISEYLSALTANPSYMVSFFARKTASMWNAPTFEAFTIMNRKNWNGSYSYRIKDILYNGGIANTALFLLMDVLQSVSWFGIILFLLLADRKQKEKTEIFLLAFLGGFVFHFFWEAKSQYALPYFIPLLPLAATGFLLAIRKTAAYFAAPKQRADSLLKKGSVRCSIVLAGVVLLIALTPDSLFASTVKLGKDTKDYIWFATHETEWKENTYTRQN